MYLTLEIVKGLIEDEKWIDEGVNRSKIKEPKTSVMTMFEILKGGPEEGYDHQKLLEKLESHGIEILTLTPEMIQDIQSISYEYSDTFEVGVLESIHIAHSISLKEQIISTNPMYSYIDSVGHIDPRKL